jgi:hypothetical protein
MAVGVSLVRVGHKLVGGSENSKEYIDIIDGAVQVESSLIGAIANGVKLGS